MPLPLTARQRALASTLDSCVVLAGPGSGKTRAVISRLLEHPSREDHRGVALLSFTNAVIDEARLRSASSPELVVFPNHVSTIDSFFYEFVVAPCWASEEKRACTFVPSREELRGKWFEHEGRSLSLEWFDVAGPGAEELVLRGTLKARFGYPQGAKLKRIEDAANLHWQLQTSLGNFDADSARAAMRRYLSKDHLRSNIERLIEARFFELIVDEAQDMSDDDRLVVDLFDAAGARIILVGDPDQGIYGFRGGDPSLLIAEGERIGRRESLVENFRSSPAICKVVSALRDRNEPDVPSGPEACSQETVVLMGLGEPDDFRSRVLTCTSSSPSDEDFLVLAYQGDVALAYATGTRSTASTPLDPAFRLAGEIEKFWSGNDGTERSARALARIRRLAEGLVRSHGDDETPRLEDITILSAIASAARPSMSSRKVYAEALITEFTASSPTGAELEFDFPSEGSWFPEEGGAVSGFAHSTIHGMKGLEATRVIIVAPDLDSWQRQPRYDHKSFGDVWLDQLECETRRVLYVAASRARAQLVFAVGPEQYPQFVSAMSRDGVAFTEA